MVVDVLGISVIQAWPVTGRHSYNGRQRLSSELVLTRTSPTLKSFNEDRTFTHTVAKYTGDNCLTTDVVLVTLNVNVQHNTLETRLVVMRAK
jgi:hypothetical protein